MYSTGSPTYLEQIWMVHGILERGVVREVRVGGCDGELRSWHHIYEYDYHIERDTYENTIASLSVLGRMDTIGSILSWACYVIALDRTTSTQLGNTQPVLITLICTTRRQIPANT